MLVRPQYKSSSPHPCSTHVELTVLPPRKHFGQAPSSFPFIQRGQGNGRARRNPPDIVIWSRGHELLAGRAGLQHCWLPPQPQPHGAKPALQRGCRQTPARCEPPLIPPKKTFWGDVTRRRRVLHGVGLLLLKEEGKILPFTAPTGKVFALPPS